MSEKTIGVGDIIKDFNEKLQKEFGYNDPRNEVKRLREALVGDSEDWNTDELVEKALTLHDKALAFDAIYDWHTRMQLQGEGIAHDLDRMDWLLKNPTKGYEDYDKEMIE